MNSVVSETISFFPDIIGLVFYWTLTQFEKPDVIARYKVRLRIYILKFDCGGDSSSRNQSTISSILRLTFSEEYQL